MNTLPPGTLVADLETDNLLEGVTRIHVLVTQDYHTGVINTYRSNSNEDTIKAGLLQLQAAPAVVGHNFLKYDAQVIEKLHGVKLAKVYDTLTLMRLIFPEIKKNDMAYRRSHPDFPTKLIGAQSLEAWGHRLGIHKGDYKGPWHSWSQEMEDYCVQDVAVTKALMDRVLKHAPADGAVELEHAFQACTIRLEQAGFAFDVEKAKQLLLVLSNRRDTLRDSLRKLYPSVGEIVGKKPSCYYLTDLPGVPPFKTKALAREYAKFHGIKANITDGPVHRENVDFNPGSRFHRSKVLVAAGWKPREFSDDGVPQCDEEHLLPLIGVYPGVEEMVEYLIVEKRLGQLSDGTNAWLRLEKRGRIHGEIITNGCVTGRCSHVRPNLAQVPGVKDRVGKVQPYGKECRELFTVPDGYELVGADASGLELRCLAHFMGAYDGGEYGRILLNGDIHTANMEAAGLPSRSMAKTFIYAFLYGAGDAKIGSIVGGGVSEGKKLRASFLKKFPALAKLNAAISAALAKRPYLLGIDGRKLHIRSRYAALNTLLQSAGGLVMKHAFVILNNTLDSTGWRWGIDQDWCSVAHVHDEFQSQVRKGRGHDFGKLAVQSIQEAGQFYRFRVPLDGEFRVGHSWADTH